MTVQPSYHPPREGDEAGTLLLREGSRVPLWRVLSEDVRRIEAFLRGLSEDERREVARSLLLPEDELPAFVRGLGEEDVGEALLVEDADGETVVAFGAYRRADDDGVAVTLAVAPEWRGLGVGRLLLDRLARLAANRGVDRLRGTATARNRALLDLFRESGFEVREERRGDDVVLAVDLARASGDGRPEKIGGGAFAEASLRPLFHPRSVAVVGASRDPDSVGHRILLGLLSAGLRGTVYPVNPKADQVASVRAWPSVGAIDAPLDLAVVAVPADAVPDVVEECAEAGVQGLVVVSAGFAEVGGEGKERQRALLERVRRHGMRMVGPNCLGLIHTDPDVRLNASFAPRMPPHGRIALCSQSGALGVAIIALARRLELGLSSFVSVGNKADVAADDLLEYWEEDPGTGILLFYLESFARPRRFGRLARRVGRSKPIIVVKSGRSEAGGRAAGSHTAALAASDTAVDALFRQTGVLRAESLEEMFGAARALADQPLPRGRSFAIVTNSGGPAILCADALEAAGIDVTGLSDETRERLGEFLPDAAATGNPVDMIASADPGTYRRTVETVLAAEEVDGLVVIYTPVGIFDTDEVAREVARGVRAAREAGGGGKPVYASIVGGDEQRYTLVDDRERTSGSADDSGSRGALRIPVYPFPEEIGRVAGTAVRYAEWRQSDPAAFPEFEDQRLDEARAVCRRALEERGGGWLSVAEARRVLELAGLEVAPGGVGSTPDEAVEIAERVGYPVAAKLASIEISHKTDLGAVKLGLEDGPAVRDAFRRIRAILEERERTDAMEGVLIQPMLEGTAEVMAGMSQDPVFGPVLAFGLGGIHVEVLRDVAFRVAPLTDRDAAEMVREIRGYRLLEGYRGHPPADVEALEEALLRLSLLVASVEELRELDLNPVFALEPGRGYRIADARIRVEGRGEGGR